MIAIGADQRLAGQLTGAIGRNRFQQAVIFCSFMLVKVAVYSATGSIEYAFGAGPSHCFDDVIGKQRSLIEIDLRLSSSAGYIGVGRQMDHDIVTFHRGA